VVNAQKENEQKQKVGGQVGEQVDEWEVEVGSQQQELFQQVHAFHSHTVPQQIVWNKKSSEQLSMFYHEQQVTSAQSTYDCVLIRKLETLYALLEGDFWKEEYSALACSLKTLCLCQKTKIKSWMFFFNV
jgi:hypothetical protein